MAGRYNEPIADQAASTTKSLAVEDAPDEAQGPGAVLKGVAGAVVNPEWPNTSAVKTTESAYVSLQHQTWDWQRIGPGGPIGRERSALANLGQKFGCGVSFHGAAGTRTPQLIADWDILSATRVARRHAFAIRAEAVPAGIRHVCSG